jgi:hypothetical protein
MVKADLSIEKKSVDGRAVALVEPCRRVHHVILLEIGVMFYEPSLLRTGRLEEVAELMGDYSLDDVTREKVEDLVDENHIFIQEYIP